MPESDLDGWNVELAFGALHQTYFCWWEHYGTFPFRWAICQPFLMSPSASSHTKPLTPEVAQTGGFLLLPSRWCCPTPDPGETGCKMPGKPCKARVVRRCLLDHLRLVTGRLSGAQCSFSVPLPYWTSGGLMKVTTLKPCSVYVLDQPKYNNVISQWRLQSALLQPSKWRSYGQALSECAFWQARRYIFPVVSEFIRDLGRWMSKMNTQRLQICSSADWSSCICLHQGRRSGEIETDKLTGCPAETADSFDALCSFSQSGQLWVFELTQFREEIL